MAKTKAVNLLMWIIGVLIALAVGGAFVAGQFANVVILNYLPLVVHQFVGWLIIILTIIGVIMAIANKLK